MMFGSLWLTILVPAVFIPVVYYAGRSIGKHTGLVSLIPLLFSTIAFASLVLTASSSVVSEYFYWLPGIRFGLIADGLSVPIALTVAVLSSIVVLYSIPYMEHRIHEEYHGENKRAHATYYALYLAYVASMIGVVLATNLFEFYFFFELMIIPSWALINIFGYGEREKIALMYLLWSIVGAVLFVTGALTAYGITHSFEITDLVLLEGNPLAIYVILTMLVGFLIKLATFGLHIWLPYAHAEAPTPISALLSPAMIGLAAYSVVRMLGPLLGTYDAVLWMSLVWALVTMVYGGWMVMAQNDIKRLLAYSSISQMGYILAGIASNSAIGVSGAMLHYVSHGLGKAALFLSAGAIIYRSGVRDIRRFGGLASKMPIAAIAFILGCMTISGIPPTIGFFSKFFLFTGLIGEGLEGSTLRLAVSVVTLLSTALTIAYTFWAARRIFFGPLPEDLNHVKDAPALMSAPLVILCALSVVLGLFPSPVFEPLIRTIQSILGV